jgi:hypothetical protein
LAGGGMIMGEFHMIPLKINNYNHMKKFLPKQATQLPKEAVSLRSIFIEGEYKKSLQIQALFNIIKVN